MRREKARIKAKNERAAEAAFDALAELFAEVPMAQQALPPPAGGSLPSQIRPGNIDDRPTNVISLLIFKGEYNEDPDLHVAEFMVACVANNARTPEHWLAIFLATFK